MVHWAAVMFAGQPVHSNLARHAVYIQTPVAVDRDYLFDLSRLGATGERYSKPALDESMACH